MLRVLCIALLLGVPAAAEEEAESIWLRGSGDRVWIEERGAPREPAPDAKGLTRVETSPDPRVNRRYQAGERVPARRGGASVVLGDPHWRDPHGHHDYTPLYWYPRYSYRLYRHYYYPHSYRYYDGGHGSSYDGYFGRSRPSRHHTGGHGGHGGHGGGGDPGLHRSGGGGREGHVLRGGAYRR